MLSYLFLFLAFCPIFLQAPSDLVELERFMREISIEVPTNTSNLDNFTAALNISSVENRTDDPEADKFIEELKKLATSQSEPAPNKSEVAQVPQPQNDSVSLTQAEKEELMRHPDLLYVSKLDGASFRIKIVINRMWNKDLIYPSNSEYAQTESTLSKTINKAYEAYEPFINFHMLSFDSRNAGSYFCDFILNFKSKGTHLGAFLRLILARSIGNIPVSADNLHAYVIENQNTTDSCPLDCDEEACTTGYCPTQCCPGIIGDRSKTGGSSNKNNTHLEAEEHSWPYNQTTIQNDIIDVLKDISPNSTVETVVSEPQTPSREAAALMPSNDYPNYLNYYQPLNYYPTFAQSYADLGASPETSVLNQLYPSTNSHEYDSSIALKRTNIPANPTDPYHTPRTSALNLIHPSINSHQYDSSIYDKRTYVPTYPSASYLNTKPSALNKMYPSTTLHTHDSSITNKRTFVPSYPFSSYLNTNTRPEQLMYPTNSISEQNLGTVIAGTANTYDPRELQQQRERGYVPSPSTVDLSASTGESMKIWYPKIN